MSPPVQKIDHIGIAVPNLDDAMALYKTLGFQFDHVEEVASQKVKVAFFECGESHMELLEPTSEDSPIAKFLAKRGSGVHHLCVQVEDVAASLASYKAQGMRLINEEPIIGAGGCKVAFVHPKSCSGVLLELVEAPSKDA